MTRRRVTRLLRAGALGLLGAAAWSAPAQAAGEPTFALEALGAPAAKGWFVYDAAGGREVRGRLRVVNTGSRAGRVRLYGVDGATGPTSGAVYRMRTDPRRGVGAWLRLSAESIALRPGRAAVVRFRARVPAGARAGDHLGGIVAEDVNLRGRGTVRRGRGRFRIQVRSLTIVAVQIRVPGPRRPVLDPIGIRERGGQGRQELLLGIANEGNVLTRGAGRLRVSDERGRRVQDRRFALDTMVPETAIELPVAVRGRALPEGRYRAVATLHYAGRTVRRILDFEISPEQARQVFEAAPGVAPPAAPAGPSVITLALAAVALLATGFGAACLLFRRRERVREVAGAEGS